MGAPRPDGVRVRARTSGSHWRLLFDVWLDDVGRYVVEVTRLDGLGSSGACPAASRVARPALARTAAAEASERRRLVGRGGRSSQYSIPIRYVHDRCADAPLFQPVELVQGTDLLIAPEAAALPAGHCKSRDLSHFNAFYIPPVAEGCPLSSADFSPFRARAKAMIAGSGIAGALFRVQQVLGGFCLGHCTTNVQWDPFEFSC